jgi:hypothetical protein
MDAHKYANNVEKNALIRDGLDYDDYVQSLKQYIKECEKEVIYKIPDDLDIEPYIDSHDKKVLKELKDAGSKGDV